MIAPLAPDEILDLTIRSTDDVSPDVAASEDSWWAHARCNDGSGRLADMFFSEELQDIARAKHICATCPAMIPCL
ncbi:MAG TPA: WhiB family transcriptional regulator, partial [Acidimicrobiales bacterium]|nr:WhiB family transcriptional regulator [Acidimicrobiales bacterium]